MVRSKLVVVEAEVEVLLAYRELPSNRDVVLYNQQGHCGRCRESRRRRRERKEKAGKEASNRQRKGEFWLRFRRCSSAGEHVTLQ